MHDILNVDEIIRLLASGLVVSGWRATAVALACCCRKFEDPTLDALWREQKRLSPLLNTFPKDIWDRASNDFTFKKMPTAAELARFTKYSLRMRELKLKLSEEPIPSNALSVLQLRTLNEPLLPNLKLLELKAAVAGVIPFIPLLLSQKTTDIEIQFVSKPPAVMVASMMVNLPKLCPHARSITLEPLPRDSTVTDAASEMLLTCNLDTLRFFYVDSPLTEEAYRVIFRLPNLRALWTVFTKPVSLPDVSLPALVSLDIEYHHDHAWLERFRGVTFSKLTEVTFHAKCQQVGAFLEAFEQLALATSASAGLSCFSFHTFLAWNPSYYSLLAFKQLKELNLEFSCHGGCSSSIDDEILVTLAQAMPKLKILQLGKAPCQVPGGVTIHGLIALSHHCRDISKLHVHFRTNNLIEALNVASGAPQSPQESCLPWEGCALTSLEVGAIPLLDRQRHSVMFALLRIFPRLHGIVYIGEQWKWVADMVALSRGINSAVQHSVSTLPGRRKG